MQLQSDGPHMLLREVQRFQVKLAYISVVTGLISSFAALIISMVQGLQHFLI